MNYTAKFPKKKRDSDFTGAILRQKSLIYVISDSFEGRPAWYVFEASKAKIAKFKELMAQPVSVRLPEYGEILYSGWGEEPPESLKDELRDKYGLYE